MAEQCQKVVAEFDALAQHCDTLSRDNERVRLAPCAIYRVL